MATTATGPVRIRSDQPLERFVDEGEIIVFRANSRTTGQTWWSDSLRGCKQGDALVEEVGPVDLRDLANLEEYLGRSGFSSLGEWRSWISEMYHRDVNEGVLYRVSDV